MKRESGENPEQTRCCEFFLDFKKLCATVRIPDGKASWNGTSQKTCH